MAHGMTSLSKAGRRGIDGGLPCPKTGRVIPPGEQIPGLGTSRGWAIVCTTKPCQDTAGDEPILRATVIMEPTRAEAIVAHLEHVKAEHGGGD
jgi:hypothetical protein